MSLSVEDLISVVCDIGSFDLKVGYVTEDTPHFISISSLRKTDHDVLLSHSGTIIDGDELQSILKDAFLSKLGRCDNGFSGYKLLLVDQSYYSSSTRKKIIEILFDTFDFGAINLTNQAVLSLCAQGVTTGLVVDIGYESTRISCVYNGFAPSHLCERLHIGGKHIDAYLSSLLQRQGHHFDQSDGIIRELKHTYCYAATDIMRDRILARDTTALVETYTQPNGKKIKISSERFEAVEIMFNPALIGVDCKGICEIVFETIQRADIDYRADLMKNILVCGGSSSFAGLSARLEKGVRTQFLGKILKGDESRISKFPIKVRCPTKPNAHTFLGGLVLSEYMNENEDFWVFKRDYVIDGISKVMTKLNLQT